MRWIGCLIALALIACGDDGVLVMADAGPPIDADETLIAPTVTATPGDTQVMVSWTSVPYAGRYRVGRAETANGTRTMIGMPLSAVMLIDNSVTNGVTYYYAVQAMNVRGDGPWSAEVAVRPVDVLPLAPTGVKATPGRTKVTIEWQSASDADDYLVQRASAAGGPYTTVMTATAPPFVDLGVVDNTTYYYVVVARNTGGESVPSTEVNARPTVLIPAVPGNVTVLAGSPGETTVMWDAATAATSYLVEAAAAQAGPYTFVGLATGRSLTSRWGSGAWLRVTGISAAGIGDPSAGVQRIALGTELVAPTYVRAQPGDNSVSLRWSSVTAATSFVVLRGIAQGGPYVTITTTAEKRYTDVGLGTGTYYYVVRTANAPSANSNEVAAAVSPTLPALPTGLTVDPNQYHRNVLRWLPVAGASHYVVRARHRLTNDPLIVGHPVSPTFSHSSYYGDAWERYCVSAVVAGVEGPTTEEIQVDNGAGPTMLGVTVRAAAERITIDLGAGAEYTVYRATGSNGASVAMWTGTARQWHDDTAVAGVIYRYRIRRMTPDGVAWSEEVTAQLDPARLHRPTGLVSTQQGYQWAHIEWTPVPGALGYVVYRASGTRFVRYAHATDPSFVDAPIQDAPVTYVVTAYDAAGESAVSNELLVTTAASPPTGPENVVAEPGDGFVHVTWKYGYASEYRVSRSTSSGGPYTDLGGSYLYDANDTTVSNGTTYYYVLRAIAGGVEVVSSEVSATPGPMPAPVLTTQASDGAVALSWSRVPAIWYYKIYRSETSGATTQYTTWNWPQWTDPNVVNGTTYYYRVSAVTMAGESPLGNEVSATPNPGGQSPVWNFAISNGRDVHIAWFAAPNATSYRVWRAENYNETFVPIADVVSSPYRDPTPGQHFYVITAMGPGGTSIPTSISNGWASSNAPRIQGVTADITGGKLIVAWDLVGGAEYEVCWTTTIGAPRPCTSTARTNMAIRSYTPNVPLSIWVRIKNVSGSLNSLSPSDELIVTPTAGAPAVPTLFMNSGVGQVSFEWTPVTGATSYRIWRGDGVDQPMLPFAIVTGAHAVTGLPPGLRATWAISAISGSYESSWSTEITTGPSPYFAVIPQLTVTSHAGAIMFDTGLASDDLRWQVARSTDPTWNFVNVPITTGHRGRLVVAAPSGTATYRIRVCVPLGNCGGDRYVTAAPSASAPIAPSWITVAPGNNELTVTWEPVVGATAYRVFRSAGYLQHEAKLEPIAVVSAGFFTDRSLANEIDYTYAVSAISAGGESEIADVAWERPLGMFRWAPTNVMATPANNSISVTWDPSPGTTTYSVCRSTTFDGARTCTSPASSPYVDTAVTSGATYYYFVTAQGGSGSNLVAATVP